MANNKKPRKPYKPKRKIANLLAFMAKIPDNIVKDDAICYHMALEAILRGEGAICDCDMITNVLNACAVMCLQHTWPEEYKVAVLGQQAQAAMVARVRSGKSILYTGPEMQDVKNALAIYEAQMPLMTPRDIANASYLVERELVKRNFTKSA